MVQVQEGGGPAAAEDRRLTAAITLAFFLLPFSCKILHSALYSYLDLLFANL